MWTHLRPKWRGSNAASELENWMDAAGAVSRKSGPAAPELSSCSLEGVCSNDSVRRSDGFALGEG